MRLLPLLLLACAPALQAAPPDPLAPMGYLGGHCWKGDVPATLSSVEHCFTWVLNRHAMRDTHTMRTPGKPDLVGETTYFWNPISKTIEYVYLDTGGTYARGTMETAANSLYFPPTEHAAQNNASTFRVRWNPVGDDSIQAFSEGRGKDGEWFTLYQMALRKTK